MTVDKEIWEKHIKGKNTLELLALQQAITERLINFEKISQGCSNMPTSDDYDDDTLGGWNG